MSNRDQDRLDRSASDEQLLPAGWVWTTLGRITEPVEKTDPISRPDEEFIYLDISSIDNSVNAITEPKIYTGRDAPSRARQLVFAEDVLFSTVRTYLKNIALVPEQYHGQVASTGFCVLRGTPGISGKYLFYYSLTDEFLEELRKLQRGVSYPAVRDQDVRIQPVPLAPATEQHRIVAEIETHFTRLDAGVAALKRVQATLRRYKASVLKAACEGRLVPTEADLALAEDRDYEPADALLQRILAERRAKWEAENPGKKYKEPAAPDTADLPELPEGWVWARLEQLADVVGGVTKGRNLAGKQTLALPYLRVANVQQGWLDLTEIKEIEALPSDLEKYRLRDGDLLLTEGGDRDKLGRSALWRDRVPDCIHQNHIFRARPFHDDLLPEWLMYNTNSEQGRQYFVKHGKQTTNLASINLTQLRDFPVPVPLAIEQHRIVAEVERRLSVVQEVEATVAANLKRAERLRQSILKRAFEGRLAAQEAGDAPASASPARLPGAGASDTAML